MRIARGRIVLLASLLFASAGRAGDDIAPLNPAQAAAASAFFERTKESLENVKARCGIDLELTSDFEHYDAATWKAASGEKGSGYVLKPQDVCGSMLDGIANSCRAYSDPSAWKASIGHELKRAACVFEGVQPATPDDHGPNPFAKRNMSYVNGVFTLHLHPLLANVDQNTSEMLKRGLQKNALAPKGGIATDHLDNGDPCTARAQCASLVCSSGVCAPCGPKRACAAGFFCDSHQTCSSKAEAAQREAADRACRESGLKRRSDNCVSDRECCSGQCKVWMTTDIPKRCE